MSLSIEGLSHRYAKDWAVRDAYLSIMEPGIVGLLGANGAGKSTLMNSVCGCLSPTTGKVMVGGVDVQATPLRARSLLGFLPQQAPLALELTVSEYLRFCAGLRSLTSTEILEGTDRVMELCALTKMKDRVIGNLSGGYRQRVGIAQAIVHDPRLVVFDEPTVGLDPDQVISVRELIREIGRTRTVLFSSHLMSEVEALCDRVVMMKAGMIVFDDTVASLQSLVQPKSLIASFDYPPSSEELVALVNGVDGAAHLDERTLRLEFSDAESIAQRVAVISVERNWGLRELYMEAANLEAAFTFLSKGPGE